MKKKCFIILVAISSVILPITVFARNWKKGTEQNQYKWWYDNNNGTYVHSGWQWIDGDNDGKAECYYFDSNGWLYTNTVTPDGYRVNVNGAWINNGIVQTKILSNSSIEVENSLNQQSTTSVNGMEDNIMNIQIGNEKLTATLVDNSSTRALKEILKNGPITINMRDYGSMEKVGDIGSNLPRNDKQITTEAGDLILYQGNSFVIYYEPNSWNFTRLGKINNVTKEELKKILGSGEVFVTLSLA